MGTNEFKNMIEVYSGIDYEEIVIRNEIVTRDLIDYIVGNYGRVTKLELGQEVTEIGKEAFTDKDMSCVTFNCSNLKKIGIYAFSGCKNIRIPKGVFKNVDNLEFGAFHSAEVKGVLSLPNVRFIPQDCFVDAKIDILKLKNANSSNYGVLKGLETKKLIVPKEFALAQRLEALGIV